jgi:hypothetical protein
MKVFDFLLDENFDLKIENGDLVIGESTKQHVILILATAQGSWRKAPFAGANFAQNINTNNINNSSMTANMKKALELDGLKIRKLIITQQGIDFEGEY